MPPTQNGDRASEPQHREADCAQSGLVAGVTLKGPLVWPYVGVVSGGGPT